MTDVEVLASGFTLVEAPRADEGGSLWFSDIYDGGVYRWTAAGVELAVPKRRAVGGIAFHHDGGLVSRVAPFSTWSAGYRVTF
jgi:sugar lactone lactonase YvrE